MASRRARELASKAWCTQRTHGYTVTPSLFEAFAEILDTELEKPHLGFATTKQLQGELAARRQMGRMQPGYFTMMSQEQYVEVVAKAKAIAEAQAERERILAARLPKVPIETLSAAARRPVKDFLDYDIVVVKPEEVVVEPSAGSVINLTIIT